MGKVTGKRKEQLRVAQQRAREKKKGTKKPISVFLDEDIRDELSVLAKKRDKSYAELIEMWLSSEKVGHGHSQRAIASELSAEKIIRQNTNIEVRCTERTIQQLQVLETLLLKQDELNDVGICGNLSEIVNKACELYFTAPPILIYPNDGELPDQVIKLKLDGIIVAQITALALHNNKEVGEFVCSAIKQLYDDLDVVLWPQKFQEKAKFNAPFKSSAFYQTLMECNLDIGYRVAGDIVDSLNRYQSSYPDRIEFDESDLESDLPGFLRFAEPKEVKEVFTSTINAAIGEVVDNKYRLKQIDTAARHCKIPVHNGQLSLELILTSIDKLRSS